VRCSAVSGEAYHHPGVSFPPITITAVFSTSPWRCPCPSTTCSSPAPRGGSPETKGGGNGTTLLQRLDAGLAVGALAFVVAAAVERRRRRSTLALGDGASPLLSASFLLAPQLGRSQQSARWGTGADGVLQHAVPRRAGRQQLQGRAGCADAPAAAGPDPARDSGSTTAQATATPLTRSPQNSARQSIVCLKNANHSRSFLLFFRGTITPDLLIVRSN
jgi:hypothetical protein